MDTRGRFPCSFASRSLHASLMDEFTVEKNASATRLPCESSAARKVEVEFIDALSCIKKALGIALRMLFILQLQSYDCTVV